MGFTLTLIVGGGLAALVGVADGQYARTPLLLGFVLLFAGLGALAGAACGAAIGSLLPSSAMSGLGFAAGYVSGGLAGAALGFKSVLSRRRRTGGQI